MPVRKNHLKLVVGAAGAAALTIGTVAAAFATSRDIKYSCATLGATNVSLDVGSIPTKMVAGQKSKRTMHMVVHLTDPQVTPARGQTVSGTVTSSGAKKTFPFNMKIPQQTVPIGTGPVDITASGPGTIRPLTAGTWVVKAGDLAASLTISNLGTIPDTCAAPTNPSRVFGTIAVAKDTTTTTAGATYKASRHLAIGKAKVRSHFGLRATGKVKFTLKKGTHKIAAIKGKLNKRGIAHAKFKDVKKHGRYSITAKYLGNAALKTSKDKATFTVG